MLPRERQLRQHLHADALIATLRQRFASLPDARLAPSFSLADTSMAGFAPFALKDPSLLAFDKRRQDPHSNLRTIYGIERVPCDSQLREVLDTVDPQCLRPCFTDIFRPLQRGKALEPFVFYEGHYLLAFDGSQYFSSNTIHCPQCLEKHHRNDTTTYHHQLLGAVLVHPDHREVLPLMPEPIIKQDGTCKNDCERNAAKRFFPAFRREHPHLQVIALADGLSANAPQIRELQELDIRFLLVANPGDRTFLFQQLEAAVAQGQAEVLTEWDPRTNTVFHYRWHNGVPLNESNQDVGLLMTIPGINRRTAEVVLAEIGIDRSRFATPQHLASWAGLCPGNNESAGKRRGGRTTHGDRWLRSGLVQAAWAASHTKATYLSSQYRRLARRRGKKKALVAVAHTLLVMCCAVLTKAEPYQELGADYLDKREPDRRTKQLVRQLENLGHKVTLEPKAVA